MAHPERERGRICKRIEYFHLYLKVIEEFGSTGGKKFNPQYFPAYIKDYLSAQFNSVEPSLITQGLKQKFNINFKISQIKSKIDNYYKLTNEKFYQSKKSCPIINTIVWYLVGTFYNQYIFSQDCLIQEIESLLRTLNIKFDNNLIKAQTNKITICLLLIFNDSDYKVETKYKDLEYSQCYIESELKKKDWYLSAYINIQFKMSPKFMLPIIETNLKSSEWCDNSLKIIKTSGINREPYIGYDLAKPLIADDNFILHAL